MSIFNPSQIGYDLISSQTIAAPTNNIEFKNFDAEYCQFQLTGINIAVSGVTDLAVQFSVDNGVSYFNTLGNYILVSNASVGSNDSDYDIAGAATNVAKYFMLDIIGNANGVYPTIWGTRGSRCIFHGSTIPINAIRLFPTAAFNMTGGDLQLAGLKSQ